MHPRDLAKGLAEKLLRVTGPSPARMQGRSLALAYHNVVPDRDQGRGDASLHLGFGAFRRQLDLIESVADVVALESLLDGDHAGARPRVAITFDDAYRGAVELALPELAQRGHPATLFVAPGLLGRDALWWDVLAASPAGLSAARREELLTRDAGKGDLILSQGHAAARALPGCYGCATEAQVLALAAHPGMTLGAHTWSHPNLARLDPVGLEEELTRPLAWLRARPAPSIPVLAYPYGLSSPAVAEAARAAGYTAGLLVEGGWLPPSRAQRWALPRFNVPAGLSVDGLALRLAGRFC